MCDCIDKRLETTEMLGHKRRSNWRDPAADHLSANLKSPKVLRFPDLFSISGEIEFCKCTLQFPTEKGLLSG